MIFLFDCDMNGLDSIAEVLATGAVTRIPCPTFNDFENGIIDIIPKVTSNDLVICDTITSLLNTTRGDAKLGTDVSQPLWGVGLQKYLGGDKNYLTVYDMAAQLCMRRLKNIRARDARVIVTAHEAEVVDDTGGIRVKKRGPDVNPAMVNTLIGASSDVFRLWALDENVVDEKGDVVLPKDTRMLRMRKTPMEITKFHVDRSRSEKIAEVMRDPTLPKLYQHLGKVPSWLTIYGPPGAGKTSLAVSEIDPAKKGQ